MAFPRAISNSIEGEFVLVACFVVLETWSKWMHAAQLLL